jgi:hypothetical protein
LDFAFSMHHLEVTSSLERPFTQERADHLPMQVTAEGAVPVGFANAREFRQCPFKGSASMRAELRITDALYVPVRKEVATTGVWRWECLERGAERQ